MSDIKNLTDETFDQEVKTGSILVDFHASWCGPCRTLAPILELVAEKVLGKAQICKVDIDTAPKTAARFEVTSVPTMILFKEGKEMGRLIGLKSVEAVEQFISSAV